ncbi:MAG: DUF6273 domain-containing protein [Bacilli bacterium]|nr:DUF6273 domain-containing protein [Bacilli bacterium]
MKKLGLLVMSLIIMPLLSSCAKDGPIPKKTYTITVNTSDQHFHPAETSLTFEEDDFSPITFAYTTDPDYIITHIDTDPTGSADCVHDEEEKKITITPKVNADFTIIPTLEPTIHNYTITIDTSDQHFHTETTSLSFKKDNFDPITFDYTIEDDYVIDRFSVSQFNVATCAFTDDKVTITPKQNADFTITPITKRIPRKYTITIDASDEHFDTETASLTFIENVYSPIKFAYVATADYKIADIAVTPIGSATCIHNDNQIIVTPKVNANFTIKPSMIELSSYIVNVASENRHFHASASYLSFNEGQFDQLNLGYTIDNNYLIDSITVSPSDAATCTFTDKEIAITPKENTNFSITPIIKKNTDYVVRVRRADHFDTKTIVLSFSKDDFTQQTFQYDIDNLYEVKSFTVEPENSVSYEIDEGTIKITPLVNDDINITPVIGLVPNAKSVPIYADDHITPSVSSFLYATNSSKEFDINYHLDSGYQIKSMVATPTEAAIIRNKSDGLLNIEVVSDDIESISITTEQILTKQITFHVNQIGEKLGPDAKETIEMAYGHKWNYYVDEATQIATSNEYSFIGWSFKEDGSAIIDPSEITIGEDTLTDVYAVYFTHKIMLNSESLAIESTNFTIVESKIQQVTVYFNLLDEKRFEYPPSCTYSEVEKYFTVTNGDGEKITSLIYSYDNHSLLISASSLPDGAITITVNDYHPEFEFEFVGEHLTATYSPTMPKPLMGDDFIFTLTADDDYYVPTNLNIYVGNDSTEPLPSDAYQVVNEGGESQASTAEVTIFSSYVTDNLKVTAKALSLSSYHYKINGFGVKVDGAKTKEGDVARSADPLSFAIDDIAVRNDNLLIKPNGLAWCDYTTFVAAYPGILEYDSSNMTITIKSHSDIDTIEVDIFHPGVNVFAEDNSTWQQIGELATSGYADKIFKPGDERNASMGDLPYTRRVIGTYHDPLTSDSKKMAGLTIEFVELISDKKGVAHKVRMGKTSYDTDSKDFGVDNCDIYLNEVFYGKISSDLRNIIKEVKKECVHDATGIDRSEVQIDRKIWALSVGEYYGKLSKCDKIQEGYPYPYYVAHPTDAERPRHPVGSSACEFYYTRTYNQYSKNDHYVYGVRSNGSFHSGVTYIDFNGCAAAFCI